MRQSFLQLTLKELYSTKMLPKKKKNEKKRILLKSVYLIVISFISFQNMKLGEDHH